MTPRPGRPDVDVAVVGAGQSGLATAAALQRRGIEAVVLERSSVGASWRRHYDRLTLNTDRRLSGLPGLGIPSEHGQWVPRDGFADYLEDYAAHHALDVRTADVTRLDPLDDGGFRLEGTGLRARRVVVATGASREPVVPDWGRSSLPVVHSGGYRNAAPYAGQVVLVVGAGNSGAEIAADLADGPARHVLLAVKDTAALLPRGVGPVPLQLSAFGMQLVPGPIGDLWVRGLLSTRVRDRRLGLAVPHDVVSAARRGQLTVLDAGLRAAVRRGRVTLLPAVERLSGATARLADGTSITPDGIVAATGWRPGLEPLVGHLRAEHSRPLLGPDGWPLLRGSRAAVPGLHFAGYSHPTTGFIHAAGYEAEEIAQVLTGAGPLPRAVTALRRRLPLPA